eukprot:RCo011136
MAAIGYAKSLKAEARLVKVEDDGADDDDEGEADPEYYLRQMNKTQPVIKPTVNPKVLEKQKQDQEYEEKRQKGLIHLKGNAEAEKFLAVDSVQAKDKERQKAARLKEAQDRELQERLEAEKAEKLRLKRYRRSSTYKRKCWEDKIKPRIKLEEEWKEKEEAHQKKAEEERARKAQWDRQKKIDRSWEPPQEPKPEPKAEPKQGPAKPAPKPAAGGKKGKKAFDPSMYAGVATALAKPKPRPESASASGAEAPPVVVERELPWDPEKGDKDPKRDPQLKKEEAAANDRADKAWAKYLIEWNKMKTEYQREVKRFQELGLYEEPEFRTDPSSEESDGSESSSD